MGPLRYLILFLVVMLCTGLTPGMVPAGQQAQPTQIQAQAQNQKPGPPGTIRIRVRMIPVDVVVVDSHDQPVTDLKQEDFQILEDGRPQQIRHFSMQTFTASDPAPAKPAGVAIPTTLDVRPQTVRTFLILLGRGRHQQALRSVDALIQFVQQDLLPQDRVAVYAYGRATDFTTEREPVVRVLEEYKKVADKLESWFELNRRGFNAVYGAKEVPKSLQPDIARIFDAGTALASRQVPPGRIDAEGKIIKDWDRAAGLILGNEDRAAESTLRLAVADDAAASGMQSAQTMQALLAFDQLEADAITLGLPFDQFVPRAADSIEDMQNLFTCIEYLRYIEGEKHILFFSGGGLLFPYGNTDYDKGIGSVANDARVVIDTFHTGGLAPTVMPTKGATLTAAPRGSATAGPAPPPMGSVFSWGGTASIQTLRSISAITGGRSAIYQDIGKSLQVVNDSARVQYLLGYYPDDDGWDGRYRRINVRVYRPGVRLFFRRGYFARDTLQPYDKAEFLAYSRITAAAGWADDVRDVPFKVDTSKIKDEAGQPQVRVDLKINASKVAFRSADGTHTGKLRIAIFYADGSKRPAGDVWKNVDLQLREETYQQYRKSGIPCSILIPTQLKQLYLTIVIYDILGDRVGSDRVQVE